MQTEQGEAEAAKAELPWHSHFFPWGTACSALPYQRREEPARGAPVWHMLQSMTRFIHLSPHGPKEIGFRETPCTFLDSHTHFQCLPSHKTACLCSCYDLEDLKSFKTAFIQIFLFGVTIY